MTEKTSKKRTVAIVQARYGSSRLPGKVLRRIRGHTVLEEVLLRCAAVRGIDDVWCAIADDRLSDPVARIAAEAGFNVYRGSESDVLARYRDTAREAEADVVMRVTSDCPLIDPDVCAQVLALREDHSADYACNNMPRTWPHGLDCEVFVTDWLERAAREADKPDQREHVTPLIRNHREAKKVNLQGPGGLAQRQRWTLDTLVDWTYIEAIFAHLPEPPTGWQWERVLRMLEQTPQVAALAPQTAEYQQST